MRIIITITILFVAGCAVVGHSPWVRDKDNNIGTKVSFLDPTRFGNAGELIRGNYVKAGDGFTHISTNDKGQKLHHWFSQEVLKGAPREEWAGKCKFFYVVDPDTYIILSWDFDKGANPQSCRYWH